MCSWLSSAACIRHMHTAQWRQTTTWTHANLKFKTLTQQSVNLLDSYVNWETKKTSNRCKRVINFNERVTGINPLSATWRIYPSSKWSSQWPYDGYIRHGWMTSCGRGRDSATRECFGRGSRGTIFVRSSKLSLFLPELCPFRRVFMFPRAFERFGAKRSSSGAFWFRQCLGDLFENSAPSPGIFCELRLRPGVFFENFLSFFQRRAGVTCLTAMVIPRLSKAVFGDGTSKTRMKTLLPGVGEIERRRTIDRRRDW